MNYFHYACARMLSSTSLLDRHTEPNLLTSEMTFILHPWETLMLRIVAGLNLRDCISNNSYCYGVLSPLLLCTTRCPSIPIVTWIKLWVDDLAKIGADRESTVPLPLTRRLFGAMVHERQNGMDLCLSFTSFAGTTEMLETRWKGENIPFSVTLRGRDPETGMSLKRVIPVPRRNIPVFSQDIRLIIFSFHGKKLNI